MPDIPGQGRAAGIRYRLFTLQDEPGESIAISSDPLFARLLKQYKEDVLSGTLTIESPTDRDRHWISSQQVYEYCANALHGTSNGVTRQPLSIRGLHQVDRASEDYQKTQSYFGRKAVEAKTYQNLYMAKCGYAPYTFSARQTTQSYAVPASIPKGLSGNLMEYFTARPSQIYVFNHYGSLRTMTDGPDPIGILSDHTSKALSNTDHVTHRAEASTVFLRNLPYEATSEHLQAMFGSTGLRCAEVDVQKGCAVARFSSWGEASRAVQEHNGTNLMGRQIYVESDNRITVGPSANTSSQARILGVPETKSPIVVDGSGASGANSKLPRHRSVSAVNQMSNHPQKGPG